MQQILEEPADLTRAKGYRQALGGISPRRKQSQRIAHWLNVCKGDSSIESL